MSHLWWLVFYRKTWLRFWFKLRFAIAIDNLDDSLRMCYLESGDIRIEDLVVKKGIFTLRIMHWFNQCLDTIWCWKSSFKWTYGAPLHKKYYGIYVLMRLDYVFVRYCRLHMMCLFSDVRVLLWAYSMSLVHFIIMGNNFKFITTLGHLKNFLARFIRLA